MEIAMDVDRRKAFLLVSSAAAGMAFVKTSSAATAPPLVDASEVSYLTSQTGAVTRTVQEKLRERISLEDFGAVGDAVTDDRPAVDKAIQYLASFGGGRIWLGAKEYYLHDTVFVPEGINIEFAGENNQKSIFRTRASGTAAFRYVRSTGTLASASSLTFRNITFQEEGFARTLGGAAIFFWGYDMIYHDNILCCYDCNFYGYDSAVWTRFTGQAKFIGCYYWNNNVSHMMDRDASFHRYSNCLALGNKQWINADDSRGLPPGGSVSDGVSNTIIIEGCVSVNSSGVDVFINGWQAVYISKGGCDGGTGTGGAAMHLQNVQDFSIDSMYFSSSSNKSGRAGLYLDDSIRGQIRGCSFVSCDVGLLQSGPSPSSIMTIKLGGGTKIVVDGNTFRSNKRNDLSTNGYLRSSKIIHNHFESTPSRTGSEYELYINDPNSTSNIVKYNTFSGPYYSIASGAHYIIDENLFGAA
jgi:hypothetical protein